jgi:GMP synthase-like glutamine amidotransferase
MSLPTRILVVENDPVNTLGRLGPWLIGAGVSLEVVRPYSGEELPQSLAGYGGLLVIGRSPLPSASWFPAVKRLLRTARSASLPALGISLGAQLIAEAFGGVVEPSTVGLDLGPGLVAKRDIGEKDPLFGLVPFLPDVLQWHSEVIAELPPDAVLLAASTRYRHQAFRLGERMWALRFHIEPDLAMVTRWAEDDARTLAALGIDGAELLDRTEAVLDDLEEVWRPFSERFAALVKGTVGGMLLPVLEN